MKAISIQQPWGSLICSGLKDVENRSWALRSAPTRILIHTGARRQPLNEDNVPLAWWLPIENAQKIGAIGKLKTLPTSAIIGVATVERCVANSDSIWAQNGHGAEYKWVIKDAQFFKEPILNVKGRLGIFDVPGIDENNLPECVKTPQIHRYNDALVIPLGASEYDRIVTMGENYIEFNLTDDNLHLFANRNMKPLNTKIVGFHRGDDTLPGIYVTKMEILPVEEEPGDGAIIYEDASGREYEWWKVRITFED